MLNGLDQLLGMKGSTVEQKHHLINPYDLQQVLESSNLHNRLEHDQLSGLESLSQLKRQNEFVVRFMGDEYRRSKYSFRD